MKQDLRETAQEMISTDDMEVQKILNERPNGHYWIVIHHRPTSMTLTSGEKVLMRVVKAYDKRPASNLGTIILEVKEGAIVSHEINPHDIPIDWDALSPHLGLETGGTVKKDRAAKSYYWNRKR